MSIVMQLSSSGDSCTLTAKEIKNVDRFPPVDVDYPISYCTKLTDDLVGVHELA